MQRSDKPLPLHLKDFLDWLDVQKGLSSKTQENYSRFLKRFFRWLEENALSSLKPDELNSAHLWKYRIFLARQTRSARRAIVRDTSRSAAMSVPPDIKKDFGNFILHMPYYLI